MPGLPSQSETKVTPEERALKLAEDFIHKFYGMEISYSEYMYQSIIKNLTDAISDEREACAKIADQYYDSESKCLKVGDTLFSVVIAQNIRARGEK